MTCFALWFANTLAVNGHALFWGIVNAPANLVIHFAPHPALIPPDLLPCLEHLRPL
jgi:hypothetical protein